MGADITGGGGESPPPLRKAVWESRPERGFRGRREQDLVGGGSAHAAVVSSKSNTPTGSQELLVNHWEK